jgi:hypothetical protein
MSRLCFTYYFKSADGCLKKQKKCNLCNRGGQLSNWGSRELGKRLARIHQAILVRTVATMLTASENAASASVGNINITHCLLRNPPDALVFFKRKFNY